MRAIRYGLGFSDLRVAGAPIFQVSAEFRQDQVIYSNGKEYFYLLQNREIRVLPSFYNGYTLEVNARFEEEIQDAIEGSDDAIVWLEIVAGRTYHPDVPYLTENLPLEVVTYVFGGSILKVKPKPPLEGE